jgi:hypothetical protein
MDDVYMSAQALEAGLEQFNRKLRDAFIAVERAHDAAKPLWDDAMGREYERSWKPLAEAMERYNQIVGPRYLEDLIQRLHHLKGYLHGS